MNPGKPALPVEADEEIAALIATLHETGRRLEELTAGEVDAVADRYGQAFLLRHAQEQLRRSEAARQAAILNALPAHVALLDAQGRIVSVNEAWRRFGRASATQCPGHAIGIDYLEVCRSAQGDGASDALQIAEGIRSVLGGVEASFSIEYPCDSPTKPTKQRWFLLTVSPLADDRPNGAVVMHLDITGQKRMEEALRQSQKMEAVGRLAGGVAHDFNNLLGVITGYGALLLKSLGPQHPGAKRVVEIQKAAERAAGLTRQLLAFSRKQVLEPRILDLNEVVADVEKMLCRMIGEDVRLVTTLGARPGRIRADPGQIEQVLMNLVVNARDAMPTGGEVVVETADGPLGETCTGAHPEVPSGPFVILSVRDTGTGMDAETQAHVFEPFFTTKEAGKGTGLGLATVFGIVQQSGGGIGMDSAPGAGTNFRIYFPRVEGDLAGPPQAIAAAPLPQGTETVLLVEDSDSLRVLIREILEVAGYTVVECSSPEDALGSVGALDGPVHLLLTDVVMPRMSGPELAKGIRIARPDIRVLFMSGYTAEATGAHGVLGAGSWFIQKPFPADALLLKIREALDGP